MSHPWLVPFAVVIAALAGGLAVAADPPKKAEKTPPELGRVPFLRDYAAAVEQAKKEKKPLLVLFDEVPG
jgi:hypothetical protein